MSDNTGIQWTDCTWNVTAGCSRVSPGCGGGSVGGAPAPGGGCYAERDAWAGAIEFTREREIIDSVPLVAKAHGIPIGDRRSRFPWSQVDHYINSAVPYGAVVAVARLAAVVRGEEPELPAGQRAWYTGPFGWVLDDVVALPAPVECRGERKLWDLRRDVYQRVRAQYAEARRAQ
jgi:hypothetical protein